MRRMARLWLWAGILFFLAQTAALSLPDDERPHKASSEQVELIHSDTLRHNQFLNPDAQILIGNVQLFHDGITMYCDSAYFFQTTNSLEAFGHVRMLQGDTLSLDGDYLYYDGNAQLAQVRRNVVMKHRQSTLYTDSLNYDRLYNIGYFFEGGRLVDGDNTLTSEWGEYDLNTKKSFFNYSVRLDNPKFVLTSDTLHYDMQTKWAEALGPSNIKDDENNIYTEHGFYNTDTEDVRLFDRSVVANKAGRRMVGDSLRYNKDTGLMQAFGNVIYDDKANSNMLTGEYCQYNELTGQAYATDSALLKDYSNVADTLFVHADTLRLYTYNMDTDSVYRVLHGYFHVRAYRSDVQAVCDSLVYNSGIKRMAMYRDPIVWNKNQQLLGEEIFVFTNDSTIDSVRVERQALLVEHYDSIYYNQVNGRLMKAFFKDGEIYENMADGNVHVIYFPLDDDSVMVGLNYTETTQLRMFMEQRQLKRIWTPAATGTFYDVSIIPQDALRLENFAWFDYIRPRDKFDLFEWRPKAAGTELKAEIRRTAPLQTLKKGPKK